MKNNISVNKENKKTKRKMSWYGMRIFLYQFVLTFLPVILISAFTTYIFVSKSYEKIELSTEAAASQLQSNLDELLVQLQGYYVGAAEDDRVKWFVEENASYSDYSRLIDVSEVLNGNSVFQDYVRSFTIINFKTNWVFSSRGMYPYDLVINKNTVEKLYHSREEQYNPWYWMFNSDYYEGMMVPREYVNVEGLCFVIRLPAIGRNSNAMVIANIDYNALIAKVGNNLSEYDGAIITDAGNIIYSTDSELAQRLLEQPDGNVVKLSDGRTYMLVKKISTVLGMSYYVAGDTSSTWGDVDSIWGATLIIIVLALVLFGVVVWSSRRLYQPVADLTRHVGTLTGEINESSQESKAGEADIAEKEPSHRTNELESIARQINIIVNNKEQAEELSNVHKEQLISMLTVALIKGEISDDELGRNIEQIGLTEKKFYMVIVAIPRYIDTKEPVEEGASEYPVRRMLEQLPKDIEELMYLPMIAHSGVFVFTIASDSEAALNTKAERLYEALNHYIVGGENKNIELVAGVGRVHENLIELRKAYKEGRKAVEPKVRQISDLSFYTEETDKVKPHYNYDTQLEKKIKQSVEACDMENAGKYTDIFVDDMFRQGVGNDNFVYVYRMIMTIMLVPSEIGISANQDVKDSDIFSKASQIYDANRLKQYLRKDVLEPVILMIDEAQGKRSAEIMEQIKMVVEARDGDVTLAECADLLDYHPNYLWKVIKNERGTTFSDYIADYKLGRAKEMLTTTDMSVAEIAEKLKYTNAQNFIRFFNKMAGVTPGKYRQEFKRK